MDLSHRMLKEFCSTLTLQSSKLDFHHMSETDNGGIQVSTSKCTHSLKPEGMVICVSTSLWLPMCPQNVFAFFQDNKMRHQVLFHSLSLLFSVVILLWSFWFRYNKGYLLSLSGISSLLDIQ